MFRAHPARPYIGFTPSLTNALLGASLTLDASGEIEWSGLTKVSVPADGELKIVNNAGTAGVIIDASSSGLAVTTQAGGNNWANATFKEVSIRNGGTQYGVVYDASESTILGANFGLAVDLSSASAIDWSSTTAYTGAKDLGIKRSAAGILQVNNGTAATEGAIEMFESASAPAAPAANGARLFVQDNGGGKTQLVVIFPTGAVQVIATEP